MKKTAVWTAGIVLSLIPGCMVCAKSSWKVATYPKMIPFEYYNEDREITGIDIDIVQLLAEEEEKEVEFLDVPFEEIIPMVEAGEVDFAISAITITSERADKVAFSNSYLSTCARAIISSDGNVGSLDDLKGKTIGVLAGSDDVQYVEGIEEAEIVFFEKEADIAQLILDKEVDAVIIDEEIAKLTASTQESLILLDDRIKEEQYAIAVSKENEELLADINVALAGLKETGELNMIFEKYILLEEKETEDANED